tara:strand:+ start:141 stop:845 length:705 start_codon:yes stop_codon:yes gene_type:complete
MPYIISPPIKLNSKGEWLEGAAYTKESLYRIEKDQLPPVNYDKHILKPHSLCHVETPLHVEEDGRSIDQFYKENLNHFFGKCIVVKFKNDGWKDIGNGLKHKIIGLEELKEKIGKYKSIEKVLISVNDIKENDYGYHDPSYIVTLSLEAANFLASFDTFNLFGTSWKSTDFEPGSMERPIHKMIFKKALILEYINLNQVSEGEYFLNALPLNLEGASESPVSAVLFDFDELNSL